MARVTVEDCLENVENRFKLVLLASKRARQLALGTEPLVEWENDKPTVVALREIAENLVNDEMMQAALAVPQIEEESEFAEDDLAAALHAEISRELSQTVEPPATGPQATKPPMEATPPTPMSSNPMFGGGMSKEPTPSAIPSVSPSTPPIETKSEPVVEPPEQTPSSENASPFSPPKPSGEVDPSEGDQGF